MKKVKEPKDLGIKIGSKKEVFWTTVRDGCKREIETMRNTIELNEELIKVADEKILIEQENFKK